MKTAPIHKLHLCTIYVPLMLGQVTETLGRCQPIHQVYEATYGVLCLTTLNGLVRMSTCHDYTAGLVRAKINITIVTVF